MNKQRSLLICLALFKFEGVFTKGNYSMQFQMLYTHLCVGGVLFKYLAGIRGVLRYFCHIFRFGFHILFFDFLFILLLIFYCMDYLHNCVDSSYNGFQHTMLLISKAFVQMFRIDHHYYYYLRWQYLLQTFYVSSLFTVAKTGR